MRQVVSGGIYSGRQGFLGPNVLAAVDNKVSLQETDRQISAFAKPDRQDGALRFPSGRFSEPPPVENPQ